MKKEKKEMRPFEMQIRQMRKNRVILVNITKFNDFIDECSHRGIEIGVGATYGNGVVLYEK